MIANKIEMTEALAKSSVRSALTKFTKAGKSDILISITGSCKRKKPQCNDDIVLENRFSVFGENESNAKKLKESRKSLGDAFEQGQITNQTNDFECTEDNEGNMDCEYFRLRKNGLCRQNCRTRHINKNK